jgi:tripartite-type tricarboxylate transporter receptor subunit TctC
MSRKIFILVLIVSAFILVNINWQQDATSDIYPRRPISVIVASSPGGDSDLWARKISALMEEELGVKLVVSNRPGGNGGIAENVVWNSPHNGYTILAGSETSMVLYVNGASQRTTRYWDYLLCGGSPGVIAVLADSKFNTFEKFIQYNDKTRPVSISNSGVGKLWHLKSVLTGNFSEVPIRHISYNGSNPAIVALLSGEVDAVSCSAGEIAPYVSSGTVIPIVITETYPFSFDGFGEVPAITQYYPGFEKYMPMSQVLCLLLPAGLPENVRNTLHEAFNTAVNTDDMRKFIKNQNASFIGLSGEPANEMVRRMESKLSWYIYDQNISSISPETGGIKKYDD